MSLVPSIARTLIILTAGAAWAAAGSVASQRAPAALAAEAEDSSFIHKGPGFSCRVSTGWIKGPEIAEGSSLLLGPGKTPGYRPSIGIDVIPGNLRAARRYQIRSRKGLEATSRSRLEVGGRSARRYQTVEKKRIEPADYLPLAGKKKIAREIDLTRDYVVIPGNDSFLVLVLSAAEKDLPLARKTFDRLVETFEFSKK